MGEELSSLVGRGFRNANRATVVGPRINLS